MTIQTILHVASELELQAIIGELEGFYENQLEEDGWSGGDRSPTAQDIDGASGALKAVLEAPQAYPLAITLDGIMSSEEALETLAAVEQLRDQGDDWVMAADIETVLGQFTFTAWVEGLEGTPAEAAPAVGTDEWKDFLSQAIAKDPEDRTQAEIEAIEQSKGMGSAKFALELIIEGIPVVETTPYVEQPDPMVTYEGELWRLVGTGVTREEDLFTFVHLSHPTNGRQQRNAFNPRQVNDWVDLSHPLALDFTNRLAKEIGPDNMAHVVTLNEDLDQGDIPSCSSHDFCDANMVMVETFQAFQLHNPMNLKEDRWEHRAALALWNKVWALAQAEYFKAYAKPLPMGAAMNDDTPSLQPSRASTIETATATVPAGTESLMTIAPSKSRRYSYDRMTADQFNAALQQLDMPFRYFARISGANVRTVERWTKGQDDIPHYVMVLCSLLTLPGAKDMASTVTDTVIHLYSEDESNA